MKSKKEAPSINSFNITFKNIVSMIKALERGIPFCKNQGFPKLSPCYVTNWEFPVQNICYIC